MTEEENLDYRTWTAEDVQRLHQVKEANLIAPWNTMCERVVLLMAPHLAPEDVECVEDVCALVQHIELEALELVDQRRAAIHREFQRREARRHG